MLKNITLMVSGIIFSSAVAADLKKPTQEDLAQAKDLVAHFQKVPHYILTCHTPDLHNNEDVPISLVQQTMGSFLTRDFLDYFMREWCNIPKDPQRPEQVDEWDWRFGIPIWQLSTHDEISVSNIRVGNPKPYGEYGAFEINVSYTYLNMPDLLAKYYVIKEDGNWKIKDIGLQGYKTDMETYIPSTMSIFGDILYSYVLAEKKHTHKKP